MSKSDSAGLQDSGTTEAPSIEGPIREYDKYGDPTGHEYYRCAGCGVDAMRRSDVREHCTCGGL